MVSNRKITLFRDERLSNTQNAPESYFISLSLFKTNNSTDYINVEREKDIHEVQRQHINPEFIEFSFFDMIQRNRINKGEDLTPRMINFIRRVRNDVNIAFVFDEDVQKWYDLYGKFEFPWGNITKEDLDRSDKSMFNIVSKADFYKIDINN